jgi:osmotically-inducible protein OsmY
MKRTDSEMQRYVLDELDWEPSIDAAHVGVAAHEGVVTLTGHIDSYSARVTAENVVKRLAGIKAVANELEVRLPSSSIRDDTDIAEAAVRALKWSIAVPDDRIKVMVSHGWVTLEGMVSWDYQRRAAEREVRALTGVKSVSNKITVKPHVAPADIKNKIEAAFERSAELHARALTIEADGGKVTLRGVVSSWTEHDAAERAAWAAPGVTSVINNLTVESSALTYV